jgi:hypothetical protein
MVIAIIVAWIPVSAKPWGRWSWLEMTRMLAKPWGRWSRVEITMMMVVEERIEK